MIAILLITFLILILLNIPIAFALAIACLLALLSDPVLPLTLIPQRVFNGLDSFPLLAIPFFILAGAIMDRGGVSAKIINLANVLVGHIRGGLAMITIVASMIFSSMTGSSTAATAAIGKIVVPSMNEKGYSKGFSAALVAASGSLGSVIPPSITLIIFGVVGGASIGKLLIGGILPGVILGLMLMLVSYIIALIMKYPSEQKHSIKDLGRSFVDAILALFMPILMLGGILLGVFTATESAVVAILYGLILGMFVYKKIHIRDLPKIFYETILISSMVVMIIGIADLFGWLVTSQQLPQLIAGLITSITTNPYLILFFILLLLLFVGLFMEASAAIIILTPVLLPITNSMGVDPIHLGVVMISALAIGVVTPPMGVNLFVASAITNLNVSVVIKHIWPFVLAMFIGLIIIAYFPFTATWLPTFLD
ncbi:TRAP transporter large permease [Oceanobacillus jeddahense]|uniref:TRAP transporter large permease n=1 Tax=Oceanobacillus jeddahense TaxID=1462527 RepID=UPI000595C2A8|nr:TRAP transporter large permease [Oceanobacillus jeddahense]